MDNILQVLEQKFNDLSNKNNASIDEVGHVVYVGDGMVKVYGLNGISISEMVVFDNDVNGLVVGLEDGYIDVMVLGKEYGIVEGSVVHRCNKGVAIAVGKELLGRVVDPLCNPIDGEGPVLSTEFRLIDTTSPGVIDRQPISEPLQTGIKVIDSMIPIGRGQRELIIGDRQTGKTTIAIDTILNQAKQNQQATKDSDKMFCVYVAIGQKISSVTAIVELFKRSGAMAYTIIVLASASDSASMQYIAPYAGCAIAEYFRDNGMHSLIVYDDLTKHALAYRQISLLLRRPPGREAYPGDIFYLHARLLERSAKLSDALGGGSLTAIPIIETQEGDVSAYIPTNVISITDGQIFLDTELFYRGIRPAINIGLSVSRVGSSAQTKAMRKVASKLKLELAQFRELEIFSKFSSDIDGDTLKNIERGNRIAKILQQAKHEMLSLSEQVALFFMCTSQLIDLIHIDKIMSFQAEVLLHLNTYLKDTMNEINTTGDLSATSLLALREAISGLAQLDKSVEK